jgi:hypothetical protein
MRTPFFAFGQHGIQLCGSREKSTGQVSRIERRENSDYFVVELYGLIPGFVISFEI